MKQLFTVCMIFLMGMAYVWGQSDKDPVLWSYQVNKISELEYDLVFTGKIADGWHVYSQYTPEGGALPSEFTLVIQTRSINFSASLLEQNPASLKYLLILVPVLSDTIFN